MAEKNNTQQVKKEVVAEGTVKTPAGEVKKEVTAATDQPAKSSDVTDEKDIAEMISVLNEISEVAGGKAGISAIPPELLTPLKFTINFLKSVRERYKDPLYGKVIDDMEDQEADGKEASLLVAMARNVPIQELQDLADNENYGDVQGAVADRLASEQADTEAEEAQFANFEASQQAGQDYADEMEYDEAQRQELFKTAMTWFTVLGDGKLTKDEWAQVDKMRNYDKDTEDLRSQLPSQPEKVVLPDPASVQTQMESVEPAVKKPESVLEAMAAAGVTQTDTNEIGKRKFYQKQ